MNSSSRTPLRHAVSGRSILLASLFSALACGATACSAGADVETLVPGDDEGAGDGAFDSVEGAATAATKLCGRLASPATLPPDSVVADDADLIKLAKKGGSAAAWRTEAAARAAIKAAIGKNCAKVTAWTKAKDLQLVVLADTKIPGRQCSANGTCVDAPVAQVELLKDPKPVIVRAMPIIASAAIEPK
jgi:hypothetical protein